MTDLILILSRCESKVFKRNKIECYMKFHFKGYYLGNKVKRVFVKVDNFNSFEKDQIYLMWVKKISFESGVLKVLPLNHKKIN